MGTRFVILTVARSGSSYLCDRLRAQPDIWCHHEVFHPNKVKLRFPSEGDEPDRKFKRTLASLRECDREAFLEKIFDLSFGRAHVGFKILQNQGDREAFRILEDPSLAPIILLRTNVLANYSSFLAAKQSGAWRSEKMAATKRELVTFDEAEFRVRHEKNISFYRKLFDRLNSVGRNVHLIRYDELNISSRISMLLRYLDAEPDVVPMESREARGAPDIVSRFSNPEIVRSFLNDNGLMHWAYEGDTSFDPLP